MDVDTPAPTLRLSVTLSPGNRTLSPKSREWLALRSHILARDALTCCTCAYTSLTTHGRGLQVGHVDGKASNNDPSNLRVFCPPCHAILHCEFAGKQNWLLLARSEMDQADIVRRTRILFEERGVVPNITEVDPQAVIVSEDVIALANKLMAEGWDDLTSKEKSLRGFFTVKAKGLFDITMITKEEDRLQSDPSEAKAREVLDIERSLPWIRYSPQSHITMEAFLREWRPSHISQSEVAWICIDSTHPEVREKATASLDNINAAWKDLCTSKDDKPTIADLDALARQFSTLSGKWLVFSRHSEVDEIWSKIARATHAGTLGISAKVSPYNEQNSHVICVFTKDYTDVSDVNRVRDGLRRLGLRQKIGYKPDIYTYCSVYSKNRWGIAPVRYQG